MNIKTAKNSVAAMALGLAFAATAASATTVNVTYQSGGVFGTPNLSQVAKINSPSHNGAVHAGPFRLAGSGGFGNFVGFCIDLAKNMSNGNAYTTATSSAHGSAVDANIDRLFTSSYASVNTAVEGAAFQLALWEIITDTGSSLGFSSGSFLASASGAVMTQANSYLSALSGASTGGYNISYLNSGTSQNLVTVSPVPLPAALGMLGLGIASLFGLRRRKKA